MCDPEVLWQRDLMMSGLFQWQNKSMGLKIVTELLLWWLGKHPTHTLSPEDILVSKAGNPYEIASPNSLFSWRKATWHSWGYWQWVSSGKEKQVDVDGIYIYIMDSSKENRSCKYLLGLWRPQSAVLEIWTWEFELFECTEMASLIWISSVVSLPDLCKPDLRVPLTSHTPCLAGQSQC